MRLIIIYVIWRKNMQIYNLKDKLEYDEWTDNKEKIENVEQKEKKRKFIMHLMMNFFAS